MKPSSYVVSNVNRMMLVFAAITLILCIQSSLRAQGGRTLPENVPRQGDPDRQVRSQEIEAERPKRDPQLVMAEINEDFGRLRVISEEMKTATKATAAAPDYKLISDSSVEIKKRATRLKANIVFPPPPKDEKRQKMPDPGDEFQPLFAMMDKLLTSFLTNPIFTDTGGLDVQLANKARYDLEDIIKLSDKLRKSADKMQKNAGKS